MFFNIRGEMQEADPLENETPVITDGKRRLYQAAWILAVIVTIASLAVVFVAPFWVMHIQSRP